MTETPKPVSKETPTGNRPPVKWVITVKETDSTVVVQFPVTQGENEAQSAKDDKQL